MAILEKDVARAKAIIRRRSRANTLDMLWAMKIAEQELGSDCSIEDIHAWAKGELKGRSDDDTSD